jgi:hypothetical protein
MFCRRTARVNSTAATVATLARMERTILEEKTTPTPKPTAHAMASADRGFAFICPSSRDGSSVTVAFARRTKSVPLALAVEPPLMRFAAASCVFRVFSGLMCSVLMVGFKAMRMPRSEGPGPIPAQATATATTDIDSDAGGFKPMKGSPAIDHGKMLTYTTDYAGTTIPQGAGPDIGAFEQ